MPPGEKGRLGTSVRRSIAIAYAIGALLTAGGLAAFLVGLRTAEVAEATRLLTAVVQLTDEQTSRTLQSVEQGLQSAEGILVTAARGVPPNNDSSIDQQLQKLIADRPFISVIWVLDQSGREIHNSDTGSSGLDLSDQAYFTERRLHPELPFAFGIPFKNQSTDNWIIPATRTVFTPNADFGGMIVAAVDPLFFENVWSLDQALPTLSVSLLLRSDETLMMRSPVKEQVIGKTFGESYVTQQLAAGNSAGTFQSTTSLDGNARLFAFRKLTAYPSFVLVVGQAMEQILEPWWSMVEIVAPSWIIALLSMGALTLWLTRETETRRAAQSRYRQLFDASPYPTIALDASTRRFLAVSDAAVERYGWSREELLTMSGDDLYPPEDLPKVNSMRERGVPAAVASELGLRHRKKDGTTIDVSVTMRPLDIDGRPGFLATAEDITQRRATEKAGIAAEEARSKAEEQLRQSQKMEAVGQLTGGIAHDFNNILMVILANADELQENEAFDPVLTESIERITAAVLRASNLTRQMLAFSRKQPLDPKLTDLNELVGDTGKLLRRALGEQIEIDSILPGGVWNINVDRTQLETALVNLCVNARDAMPAGGKLLIETRNVTLSKDSITQAEDVLPGDYAMLSVTDTGAGMPPETLAKIFEPFFTTKDVGKGTGLGLSMVYGFIKQSLGHITVHSEVGRGTTFRLYLPRSDGVPEEAPLKAAPAPRGSERVLVVEDEPQVRASVVSQLRSLGYSVSEAPDGEAGIASFEAAAQAYDVLLTDVVMPGRLDGRALADEVARRWPRTKIVFVSGYAENSVLHDGKAATGVVLLSKPFRKSDLARTIRLALDG